MASSNVHHLPVLARVTHPRVIPVAQGWHGVAQSERRRAVVQSQTAQFGEPVSLDELSVATPENRWRWGAVGVGVVCVSVAASVWWIWFAGDRFDQTTVAVKDLPVQVIQPPEAVNQPLVEAVVDQGSVNPVQVDAAVVEPPAESKKPPERSAKPLQQKTEVLAAKTVKSLPLAALEIDAAIQPVKRASSLLEFGAKSDEADKKPLSALSADAKPPRPKSPNGQPVVVIGVAVDGWLQVQSGARVLSIAEGSALPDGRRVVRASVERGFLLEDE